MTIEAKYVQGTDGKWHVRLLAGNNKVVFWSEGYDRLSGATNAVEVLAQAGLDVRESFAKSKADVPTVEASDDQLEPGGPDAIAMPLMSDPATPSKT